MDGAIIWIQLVQNFLKSTETNVADNIVIEVLLAIEFAYVMFSPTH